MVLVLTLLEGRWGGVQANFECAYEVCSVVLWGGLWLCTGQRGMQGSNRARQHTLVSAGTTTSIPQWVGWH